jgi:thiol-disulfide isomerase/thioredoxin
MNFDAMDFPNSLNYNGDGAGTNEYLTEKVAFIKDNQLDNAKLYFELDKPEFDKRMTEISKDLDYLLENANDLDPEVYKMEQANNEKLNEFYNSSYASEHGKLAGLKKGDPSPKFNYPNTKGEKVSLDDLRGKYVYVDVWATWCGPCKQQIPFLKELDKEYSGKNIAIVSLSIDKESNKDKWLQMVADEKLTGIQIMADDSDFATAYNISGIPRFILIDPEGNILDSNAPRPSDPRLKQLFESLNL